MTDLFDTNSTWNVLEKAMDISADRHRLIANNLANIDTIGYTAKDVDFKQALQEALGESGGLDRTHPKHMAQPSASRDFHTTGDGMVAAPVNIDREMTHLVENNIKYRTSIEMLLRKMNMLRHSITEAGK